MFLVLILLISYLIMDICYGVTAFFTFLDCILLIIWILFLKKELPELLKE